MAYGMTNAPGVTGAGIDMGHENVTLSKSGWVDSGDSKTFSNTFTITKALANKDGQIDVTLDLDACSGDQIDQGMYLIPGTLKVSGQNLTVRASEKPTVDLPVRADYILKESV